MNGVVSSSNADTDRLALLAIQSKITEDPQGVFRSWNDSLPLCQWEGVTCGRRHQRVTTLDLSGKGLVGSLSPYVGNLSFLRYMNFSNNQLHGSIPPEIGRLSRLQLLSLPRNSLTGEIPVNISSCSKLQHIDLSTNMLSGKIPTSFSSMLTIKSLSLGENKLTGGIPPSIGNLTSLQQLVLSLCPLGGSIPESFNRLNNLQLLSLGGNDLVGPFPLFIFNLSKLELLKFPGNQLVGRLPSNLCSSQPHLQTLEFEFNHFSGILPPSISNCSELESFDVSNNDFEGEIDIEFGKLQYLRWLSIGLNNFETEHLGGMKYFDSLSNCSNLELMQIAAVQLRRQLPNSFGNLTKLNFLVLPSSYISGSLPSSIGNLVSLSILSLSGNNFTGMIPENIGMLGTLGELHLDINSFSGIIPRSIGNLSSLTKMYLGGNKLEGAIPSTIGKCKILILLSLRDNNLRGSVPKELFQLSSLSIRLDLSRNNLSGVLPQEISNLKHLGSLYFSDNHLSGELPSSISRCISLELLDVSGNRFHGSMPVSLSSLRALQYVDVSGNNFSGHIPTYLQEIPLKLLNLSDNNFEGEVAVKGVFANASALSVSGNPRLCGGIPELHLPICRTKRSRKLSLRVVVAISLSSTVAGLGLVSFVLFYCCIKKRSKPSESTLTESFKKISYGRLFKATAGFSAANLIGTGGFGSVYKGVLDENDLTVAIKVLNLQRRGGSRSFMAECEALRNIRHRNLVKVITSCSSLDFQGNDFKALVYDFMPNGSLETWLHSSTTLDHLPHDQLHQLDLVQRISIAKDVAYALDYPHYRCGNVVVHRDLKPSNILLDADMVAHVGDFGLAKILSLDELSDANKSSSSHVRGTIGYAPPEYGVGNEVSPSGDIYSYGILLLEMLTGKRPVDPMFREGLSLHSYATSALAGGCVLQIVDPMLLHDVKEMCLISLLKIGVHCSFESPQDRMDIGTVIHELLSLTVTASSSFMELPTSTQKAGL
ncbi:putative receptor-like protein kinase At3g47110 [Cynara cardunculus var. scolymus]|nr:putative receptor-like protein kinase At3g47110 [Cynara cardunculus var. scolymus]